MGKAIIDEDTLTGIADAIRTKKGTTELIPTPNMRSEILSISGGGSTEVFDHTVVNSIIADGASYIKTDIYPSPNYTIEMEFKLHTVAVNWDFIFGTREGNYGRWQARFNQETSGVLKIHRSKTWNSVETVYSSSFTKENWLDYKVFKLAKNEVYVDGELLKTLDAGTDGHYPYSVYLFSVNAGDDDTETEGSSGYIDCKYAKIWDENDNLVLDLIPVVKSDGTVCMFDQVHRDYYYNAGTGTFTYS